MHDDVAGALVICVILLGIMLFFWAVHRMNNDMVFGLVFTIMGMILLGVGLNWRIYPHVIASFFPLLVGFYHLYRGIPLELRERRYRAMSRRWEKLDEELEERDKEKREGT